MPRPVVPQRPKVEPKPKPIPTPSIVKRPTLPPQKELMGTMDMTRPSKRKRIEEEEKIPSPVVVDPMQQEQGGLSTSFTASDSPDEQPREQQQQQQGLTEDVLMTDIPGFSLDFDDDPFMTFGDPFALSDVNPLFDWDSI
jgi:hypothetical protein